jgi:hypothetical protein
MSKSFKRQVIVVTVGLLPRGGGRGATLKEVWKAEAFRYLAFPKMVVLSDWRWPYPVGIGRPRSDTEKRSRIWASVTNREVGVRNISPATRRGTYLYPALYWPFSSKQDAHGSPNRL